MQKNTTEGGGAGRARVTSPRRESHLHARGAQYRALGASSPPLRGAPQRPPGDRGSPLFPDRLPPYTIEHIHTPRGGMTSRGSDDQVAGLDPAIVNQIAAAVEAAVAKERAEALAEHKVQQERITQLTEQVQSLTEQVSEQRARDRARCEQRAGTSGPR